MKEARLYPSTVEEGDYLLVGLEPERPGHIVILTHDTEAATDSEHRMVGSHLTLQQAAQLGASLIVLAGALGALFPEAIGLPSHAEFVRMAEAEAA